MTQEQCESIKRLVDEVEQRAYRHGWRDAMTELRKLALVVRYNVPQPLITQ